MSICKKVILRLFIFCGLAMGISYMVQPTPAEACPECFTACQQQFQTCVQLGEIGCDDQLAQCRANCNGL
jgi:hypothetical protein